MKITATNVKNLTYTKEPKVYVKNGIEKTAYNPQYIWDNELKGFGVRVFPSGRKAFVITYYNETNKKCFHTLGNYPEITVKQARDIAREKFYAVSKGIDPQQARHEKRQEMDFEELAKRYLEYSKEHKRSYKDDNQRLRDHLLPAFGKKKLSEITLSQTQRHMAKLREKLAPATVNRCIALLKHMFTMAMRWQIVQQSPVQHLRLYKEPPPCDIVLSPEECQRILKACDEEENIYAAAMFKLAIYTGRRAGEIRTARWEDVTIYQDDNGREFGRLTIRETKSGEQQHIPLGSLAIEVINSLPQLVGNPYIIAGSAPRKPLQTYSKAWRRVLKRAEVDYVKPHGMRHNYVSMLLAAGEPMEIVGKVVGHKNIATTQKYAHHRPEWLHKTTERFGEVINMSEAKKTRKVKDG